jgi:very-short-patch-repair endonuclease
MAIKSLEFYIEKHGVEKGTRVYNTLSKRTETYNNQPHKRGTKEWYIWRYGEKEGIERYNKFATKSAHTLDNFIRLHGEEKGRQMYNATMAKKNTVKLVKDAQGEDAVRDWYKKAVETRRLSPPTAEELKTRGKKISETKRANHKGRTKLQIYIDRFGYEEGPKKYAEYLAKIFKGIGTSKEASSVFTSMIEENPWLKGLTCYWRDGCEGSEWFIADRDGVSFYDFTVKESKTILEYDGARWHPTQEQVDAHGDEMMEITNISFKEKFTNDQQKLVRAKNAGFDVFKVRNDFTPEQTQVIIKQFLQRTKEKCNL